MRTPVHRFGQVEELAGSLRLPRLRGRELRERRGAVRGRRLPGQRRQPVNDRAGIAEPRVGHRRWVICALLFFATTINYVDRQVIGILKPTLVQEFGWADERIYAAIVFTFQLAYAIGLFVAGRVMDKLGTKLGFSHRPRALERGRGGPRGGGQMPWLKLPTINLDSTTGLSIVMLSGAAAGFALPWVLPRPRGSGQLPGLHQDGGGVVPEEEHALATGIFNSGTNVGALRHPAGRSLDHAPLGLAVGVHRHRPHGLPLARLVGEELPSARGAPRLSPAEMAYIRNDPAGGSRPSPGASSSPTANLGPSRSASS